MSKYGHLVGRTIRVKIDGHEQPARINRPLVVNGGGLNLELWHEDWQTMIYVTIPLDDARLQP